MFVAADDAVGDLSVRIGVPAGRLHSEQLSAHGHVLRHGRRVFAVLEHWRVVVDVQDRDHDLADCGETWRALVAGQRPELIRGLQLAVQGAFQADDASLLVNGEKAIGRIQQRVDDVAVQT